MLHFSLRFKSSEDSPLDDPTLSIPQLEDRFDRDLRRLEEILSGSADGSDMLQQVAQILSGILGVQAIVIVNR